MLALCNYQRSHDMHVTIVCESYVTLHMSIRQRRLGTDDHTIGNQITSYASPGPSPPGEAWYTLLAHAQNIFRKKLCALPCPYAEDYTTDIYDYTNQDYRAFFELVSSNDLTPRGYYLSDVAVSFI